MRTFFSELLMETDWKEVAKIVRLRNVGLTDYFDDAR
jgi:hypothetical protein